MSWFGSSPVTVAIPAIISGGIADNSQLAATFVLVGFVYPFFEGIAWNATSASRPGSARATSGKSFMTSPVRWWWHAMGGWIALPAVLLLYARHG